MDPQPSPTPVRIVAGLVSAASLLLLPGCAGDSVQTVSWDAVPVEAPFLESGGMPHLSPSGDGAILSWWSREDGGHALRAVRWSRGDGFGEVRTVTRGDDFFVNWADYPSVVEVAPAKWVAHWLQRNGEGTFAYGIRTAVSTDDGVSWSDPWTPHEDGTATEHGFVSTWPDGAGGWSLVWLDGRKYAEGPHGEATMEMTIRARTVGADGSPGPETLVDVRSCDCCQTDAALTSRGPVVAYRDRTAAEIRDIYFARRGEEGWTEPHPVHDDGWEIGGCPVNGPALDASGEEVVITWFTAAGGIPRVLASFSSDAGDTFGDPVRVDDGNPIGRVDVVRLAEGGAVVSWLEDTGERGAEIRIRRIGSAGSVGPAWTLARTSAARASGFPQFIRLGGSDGFLAAWTEVGEGGSSAVRVKFLEAE